MRGLVLLSLTVGILLPSAAMSMPPQHTGDGTGSPYCLLTLTSHCSSLCINHVEVPWLTTQPSSPLGLPSVFHSQPILIFTLDRPPRVTLAT